jgi:hypothetical protein
MREGSWTGRTAVRGWGELKESSSKRERQAHHICHTISVCQVSEPKLDLNVMHPESTFAEFLWNLQRRGMNGKRHVQQHCHISISHEYFAGMLPAPCCWWKSGRCGVVEAVLLLFSAPWPICLAPSLAPCLKEVTRCPCHTRNFGSYNGNRHMLRDLSHVLATFLVYSNHISQTPPSPPQTSTFYI